MKMLAGFVLLLLTSASGFVIAQDKGSDDKATEVRKHWADVVSQTLAETQNLRLPENRAMAYVLGGVFIWESDPKQARQLFQTAAVELIAAQESAEARRKSDPNNELLRGGNSRTQILNTIASRDAELALELLVKTRPAIVQAAMLSVGEKTTKVNDGWGANRGLVQTERSLEESFYRLASEQNPQNAIRLLEELLKKGVTTQTLDVLRKIAEKDEAAAADLAKQAVSRLLSESYLFEDQPNYTNLQVSMAFLRQHMQTGEKKLKLDASQMRSLAEKLIAAYLGEKRVAPYIGSDIQKIAEKVSPAHVPAIKKAASAAQTGSSPSSGNEASFQRLFQQETPVATMIEEAANYSTNQRRQIYQAASNRLTEAGDHQAARAILTNNFDGVDREQAILNFNRQLFYRYANAEKYADAEALIEEFPDTERVALLASLAQMVFAANEKENRSLAVSYLTRAYQALAQGPETSEQMSMLSQVINGYIIVDIAEGIRLFEGVVPKINELTEASAILGGFQGQQMVRSGEFVMSQGDHFSRYGADTSILTAFAKADPDRTVKIIDRFSRAELRIFLKLQLASSLAGTNSSRGVPSIGRFRSHTIITTFH